MSLTEICSRKHIKDLCYFKKSHHFIHILDYGGHHNNASKMFALGELLALPVAIFTQHNSENKILIWWPQLLKELTGGDGYKYRFKPNAVPSIFPHKESKRPGCGGKSTLRNSSSGRASWLASVCLHPNRWHLAFLVSAVCKLFQ